MKTLECRTASLMFVTACCLAAPRAHAISEARISAVETSKPNTFALEASAVIDATPLATRHVILRQCQEKNMSGSLVLCQMFQKEGNRTWNYSVSKYPVLSPRDVVLERLIPTDLNEKGEGTFRMEWKLADLPNMGPRPGHVRPGTYEGFWIVEPLADGKRCRATYRSMLEPGGFIPLFVMKWATKHGIPKTLERLEEVAQEKQKAGVIMVPHKDDPWAELALGPLDEAILKDMGRK